MSADSSQAPNFLSVTRKRKMVGDSDDQSPTHRPLGRRWVTMETLVGEMIKSARYKFRFHLLWWRYKAAFKKAAEGKKELAKTAIQILREGFFNEFVKPPDISGERVHRVPASVAGAIAPS
jgi:hypothetical protein